MNIGKGKEEERMRLGEDGKEEKGRTEQRIGMRGMRGWKKREG
jgi:hypothetical protein